LTENKNLKYLIDNEQMLAEQKAQMEEQALKMLQGDLE
jgi:hypothetical protein